MELTIDGFPDGGRIPSRYAFGRPDPTTHVTFSDNLNPRLWWTDVPEGTRSFAIVCIDRDAPADRSDANLDDRTLPVDLPRQDFYHWVLVEIPVGTTEIAEGAVSTSVTPRGKAPGTTEYGRTGRNDYTDWFAGDPNLEGVYGGYDGPGPPWNDERVHRYEFLLFALDVETLDLANGFGGDEALAAMEGHVLARAKWMGTYSLNPSAGS